MTASNRACSRNEKPHFWLARELTAAPQDFEFVTQRKPSDDYLKKFSSFSSPVSKLFIRRNHSRREKNLKMSSEQNSVKKITLNIDDKTGVITERQVDEATGNVIETIKTPTGKTDDGQTLYSVSLDRKSVV